MLIGLTGQIGAGKTEVARLLKRLGAQVIDADQIGRNVVNQNAQLRRQLATAFGEGILTSGGALNRGRLAQLAFATKSSKKRLDAIVHPFLLPKLRTAFRRANRPNTQVVIDAALLLEWHLEREVDLVIVVTAPSKLRLERLARRGFSLSDSKARERFQHSQIEFVRKADIVIRNSGTRRDLAIDVKRAWDEFVA